MRGALISPRTGGAFRGVAAPAPPPPVFDFNYAAGTYLVNGTAYASEALALTALGATGSAGKIVVGPYEDPASPELVPDSGVATGAGWSATQVSGGPASGAVVSGEYQVTAAVSASRPGGYAAFPVQPGQPYRARGKVRKDAAASTSAKFVVSNAPTDVNGPVCGSALIGATALTQVPDRLFAPMAGIGTMYAGVFAQSGVATGMWAADDVSVKAISAYAGASASSASGYKTGTTPAPGAVDKVLLSWDDGALDGPTAQQRNYFRIVLTSTGRWVMRVYAQTALGSTGTTQISGNGADLGAAVTGDPFRFDYAIAPGIAGVSFNGGAATTRAIANLVGMGVARFKQGQDAANDFDGYISRNVVYRDLTAPFPLEIAYAYGDSYASQFFNIVGAAANPTVRNYSQGGTTRVQQLARLQAYPPKAGSVVSFWDGASNEASDATSDLALVQQMIDFCLGLNCKVILFAPMKRSSTSVSWAMDDAIRSGMQSKAAANPTRVHFINALPLFKAQATGSGPDQTAVSQDYMPPTTLQGDETHPTDLALAPVKTAWDALYQSIK